MSTRKLTTRSPRESESESGSEDDDVKPRSIRQAFKIYLGPMILTMAAEVWYCSTMYNYCQSAGDEDTKNMAGNVRDSMNLGWWCWAVFFFCIFMRVVIVLVWHANCRCIKDSHVAALFMFFSTFQWVYFLISYYRVREELTGLTFVDTLVSASSASASPGHSGHLLARCIDVNGTVGCQSFVRPSFECGKTYNPLECTSYAWVGQNETKCCVETKYSLAHPHEILNFWFWHPTMSAYYSTIKWVAVLAMKWVLEKNPLMPRAYSPFVQGSLVDILDSLIFLAYLESPMILNPKYGIGSNGLPVDQDSTLWYRLLLTCIVALSLSVLSPCLYIFFRSDESVSDAVSRVFADAMNDIMKSVRMLRTRDSHKYVDEAIQLQLESYKHMSSDMSEMHTVKVVPEDLECVDEENWLKGSPSAQLGLTAQNDDCRHGLAEHQGCGIYTVEYADDGSTEKVDVCRIRPDVHAHANNPCAKGCCSGICAPMAPGHDSFEHKAEIIDAFRSLFFLEIPFFLWRYYFEIATLDLTSWTVIVMLKNLVWGFHDFLVLISCNNPAMTIFGFTPLATLSTMINGSAMASVFVGPAGFVQIAADLTTTSLKSKFAERKAALDIQKAWLLVEREKARATGGSLAEEDEDVERFSNAIAQTEAEIEKVDQQLEMVHS